MDMALTHFALSLQAVSGADVLTLDGIEFHDAAFIRIAFDGLTGEALAALDEAVLVFPGRLGAAVR